MPSQYFIRVGALGNVGRFRAADGALHSRGARVVVRTGRGLEVGEVLGEAEGGTEADGTLLRRMTVEDELLQTRLEKNKQRAILSCEMLLSQRGEGAVLMDVEQLFDGGSLFFYFLGDVPAEVEALTAELAEAYEAKVRFRQFTEAVMAGCGPGCGTESAAGCGTSGGGCATCAVAGACAPAAQ